ncbi:hypothetical protein LWI29_011482 [Acer saccharum]|uniref:Uncharacterized protein n=1 Tax=Acer saccharum TaxID=4024 RepID=A0AA39VIP7_ACESA|nr:hypothetical protein LWI29_011482 [Acer saccharum]
MSYSNTDSDDLRLHNKNSCRSPLLRTRNRRWRHSRTGTAVVVLAALLLSTTAWLSLVFSSTTTRCWLRFKKWEGSPRSHSHSRPHSLPWVKKPRTPSHLPPHSLSSMNRIRNRNRNRSHKEELSLKHIVFGIAGSSHLWKHRKQFLRLWWLPKDMRGHVWLEEKVPSHEIDDSLPPVMVSEDISSFRYTNPTGHPSGLRISRILTETFRLGLPDVRWFVLGDDDTIFNSANLVAVLSKYDPTEMVYIGTPSESHSANTYFSHSMAFGGGGIAISYPLAEALSVIHDACIDRYPKLYGSDDRLHACITELGIPLTIEHGFHQWDIRGNAHGLLSSHPIAPFVSIHHVEAVDPLYPGLTSLDSLKLFTKAMKADPRSFLQRSTCYDWAGRHTISVSLGYVVQVFPNIVLPHELERSEKTYSAWNRISHRNEFDFDTRDPYRSVCKRPALFFLNDMERQGNVTVGSYLRATGKDNFKRKVFCFPRLPPLRHIKNIQVLGYPLRKNWHLAPRRLCCKINQTSDEILRITVGQCGKGVLSSVTDSV